MVRRTHEGQLIRRREHDQGAMDPGAMDRSYETAKVEDKGGGLVLLTLNRPQVANAMNTQMGRDLLAFFDAVNADPLSYRCIVVTGAGDKAFCAGGDLKERQGMSDENGRRSTSCSSAWCAPLSAVRCR